MARVERETPPDHGLVNVKRTHPLVAPSPPARPRSFPQSVSSSFFPPSAEQILSSRPARGAHLSRDVGGRGGRARSVGPKLERGRKAGLRKKEGAGLLVGRAGLEREAERTGYVQVTRVGPWNEGVKEKRKRIHSGARTSGDPKGEVKATGWPSGNSL